ncbi:MAG: SUMF1/EgtB/PvdO family nonheme iron enzyme [Gemmatimonadetes bacterium]|nr:SUMF1/EgtB/PvdO family nonheme iron enzyme [Gemmatimonadota bacterium]MYF72306.1 SUMF1/EgtB/PvdO family nonheme iron enzyme [Gemmatimonadota bacterium]
MKFKRKSIIGLLATMGIVFAGIGFVYAQTAADVDYDGDGVVGVGDFLLFVARFGTNQGDPNYEAEYDLDGDGQVGVSDFLVFFGFFGQSAVPNDAPVLQRIGDQGVPKGGTLTLELVASDPDGDNLTYSVSGNPAGSSLSGTTFLWTPTSESETHRVTFTVKDGKGGTDTETITLRVVEFQFKLIGHRIQTELPSFVNILFQVIDSDNWGVSSLSTNHFEVRENGQPVSPTESKMHVRKREAITQSYTVRTVLMLDTSASVEPHLAQIKEAAITLVKNMTNQQEIALYEFSEEPVLLQNFTNDVDALIRAIQGIRLGFATTNLYGSVIAGSARWWDAFTTTGVQQGVMIILTDGSDTQGSHTLSEALSARGDKNIYTIGLGNEIDPEVLQEIGNAGFFQITDVSKLSAQLTAQFVEIQSRIASFADSFYWLKYLSPKRGDRAHELELSVKGNQLNSTIEGEFYSRDFCSVRQGVYVNYSPCSDSDPEGVKDLQITRGDTVRLQAVTYPGAETPQYSWESSNSDIVVIEPDPVDASVAWAIAVGDRVQIVNSLEVWPIAVRDTLRTATLRVFDQSNRLDRQVEVEVRGEVRLELPTHYFPLPGGASLEMIWIEPGTFHMGSLEGLWDDEGPVHEVTISQGFYLGKYEVTQEQWELVMGTRPWRRQDHYVRSWPSYPVVYVSWEDAQEFISRLNASLSRNLYRLPTEAEWEYACRAGTTTRWSHGDAWAQLQHYAWYNESSFYESGHIVGRKRANPYGLYDMHGNVSEWVQDWYDRDYYRSSPSVDPQGPLSGSNRVIRGGNFDSFDSDVRSASRSSEWPGGRGSRLVGFRLLRQAQ